jgi:hypothetical protein
MDQRLFNNIDTKAFVRLPFKQDSRWVRRHSLCLFADPLAFVVFLEWCYFVNNKNFNYRIKNYYTYFFLRSLKCIWSSACWLACCDCKSHIILVSSVPVGEASLRSVPSRQTAMTAQQQQLPASQQQLPASQQQPITSQHANQPQTAPVRSVNYLRTVYANGQ